MCDGVASENENHQSRFSCFSIDMVVREALEVLCREVRELREVAFLDLAGGVLTLPVS